MIEREKGKKGSERAKQANKQTITLDEEAMALSSLASTPSPTPIASTMPPLDRSSRAWKMIKIHFFKGIDKENHNKRDKCKDR